MRHPLTKNWLGLVHISRTMVLSLVCYAYRAKPNDHHSDLLGAGVSPMRCLQRLHQVLYSQNVCQSKHNEMGCHDADQNRNERAPLD